MSKIEFDKMMQKISDLLCGVCVSVSIDKKSVLFNRADSTLTRKIFNQKLDCVVGIYNDFATREMVIDDLRCFGVVVEGYDD